MKITYKTEIKPTTEQVNKIKQNIGTCCWIYNQYVRLNTQLYEMRQRGLLDEKQADFVSANDFAESIRQKLTAGNDLFWVGQCDSYARKITLINAEKAFKRFFQGRSNLPKLKKFNGQDAKLHLKSKKDDAWIIERHRVNIPTIGFVKLKEFGYLPIDEEVLSGTVSCEAGRYYVAVTVEKDRAKMPASDKNTVESQSDISNINDRIEKIEKKIWREKRSLDRKYASRNGSGCFANIEKQREKIDKLEQRLRFMQQDCWHKAVKFDRKDV